MVCLIGVPISRAPGARQCSNTGNVKNPGLQNWLRFRIRAIGIRSATRDRYLQCRGAAVPSIADPIMKRMLLPLAAIAAIATTSFAAAPPEKKTPPSRSEIRARLISVPKPEYPEIAQRLHHTGSGLFGLYFDVKGEVSGIRILKSTGYPELDIAALKGLVRWRAKPGPKFRLGVPVKYSFADRPRAFITPYLDRPEKLQGGGPMLPYWLTRP